MTLEIGSFETQPIRVSIDTLRYVWPNDSERSYSTYIVTNSTGGLSEKPLLVSDFSYWIDARCSCVASPGTGDGTSKSKWTSDRPHFAFARRSYVVRRSCVAAEGDKGNSHGGGPGESGSVYNAAHASRQLQSPSTLASRY